DPFTASGDDRERRLPGIRDPHIVLDLGHVLLRGGRFGEGPGQHELGLENRPCGLNDPVEGRAHPPDDRMADAALNILESLPGVAFKPVPIESLGGDAKLNSKVSRQIYWFGLSTLFLP